MRLLTRTKILSFAGITILALAVGGIAGASGALSFPGSDEGIQRAVRNGAVQDVSGRFSANGLTVRVDGVIADTTETALAVHIDGLEADGNMAMPLGRPQITDSSGRTYFATMTQPDQTNPRSQTWIFPSLATDAAGLTLSFDGVSVWERPVSPSVPPVRVRTVNMNGRLSLNWSGPPIQASVKAVTRGSASFAKGRIVVDTVATGSTGTVVTGHLEGFTPDEVPEFDMLSPSVVLADGTTPNLIRARNGFGTDRAQFEFRFAESDLTGARLVVPFHVAARPHNPGVGQSLAPFDGQSASLTIRFD